MQKKVNETTRNKNKPESGKEKAKEHNTREQSDELKDGETSEIVF